MDKRIKKMDEETKLERVVRVWMNNEGRDYDDGWQGAYKDLERGGCQSGMVGKLIYYTDTTRFYRRHRDEIAELLQEILDDTGEGISQLFGGKWDDLDPLANDMGNQNLLAWFGFEEMARKVAQGNGYDC